MVGYDVTRYQGLADQTRQTHAMPVASPAAAVMAAIGSSTHHAADIVVGIVVVVALIVFLVWHFLARRGASRRR